MLVIIAATLGAGTRYVRQEPVTVLSPAQLPGHEATPAPPGLGGFPKPDEAYVSPAPTELLHQLPASQLADRFPKVPSYGTIGTARLASPPGTPPPRRAPCRTGRA